jgi:hypothetical protein
MFEDSTGVKLEERVGNPTFASAHAPPNSWKGWAAACGDIRAGESRGKVA